MVFELESSSIMSCSSCLVVHLHNSSLLIINLLIKATIKPAPIGSNIVGTTNDAEKLLWCWIRGYRRHIVPRLREGLCMYQVMPPFDGDGAVGAASSFPRYPSPSGPSRPAYKSAMLP